MELPLPIAALTRRVRSAKSAKERHDLAYFAWEASVRLAVAARPPSDASSLAMPSIGHWVRALTVGDARLDAPPILAAYARLLESGQERGSSPRTITPRKLFDAIPAYRNQVMGHGAVRSSDFYDEAGAVLADGIDEVWKAGAIWPTGSALVYVETVELDPHGGRRGRVLQLGGPLSRVDDPRGTALPDGVLPRRVYVRTNGVYESLHPFVIYEEADLRERILFFNGRRKTSEFLDYVSGERLRGRDLAAAFAGIEEDLATFLAGAASADERDAEPRDPSRYGDYRLLGKLGEGGMGVVYLAKQETLDRLVALKMLPTTAAENPVTVARFQREITALARCDHPNVIKILASGHAEGTHYYTMELVEGADLAGLARALTTIDEFDDAVSTASERVRLARADAYEHIPELAPRQLVPGVSSRPADRLRKLVELFRDAARGVAHLHEMGIVHRDLKPANLMVTAGDHRVVVMDLGLAALGDASESLTRDESAILGTLRYMPPEQLQRNLLQLDRRADIYSLGATFYELLVGRALFDGDNEVRLLEQVLRENPLAPGLANPRLPKDVATILAKAIEKDPKARYDDAEALGRDLDAFLEGRPITARPPSLGYVLQLAIRRHRAVAITTVVAALLLVGGATAFLIRERGLRDDAVQSKLLAQESERKAVASLDAAEKARHKLEHLLYAASRNTHRHATLWRKQWEKGGRHDEELHTEFLATYADAKELYEEFIAEFPDPGQTYEFQYYLGEVEYFSGNFLACVPHYAWVRDHRDLGLRGAGIEDHYADAVASIAQAYEGEVAKGVAAGTLAPMKVRKPEELTANAGSNQPQPIPELYLALQREYDRGIELLPDSSDAPQNGINAALISESYLHLDDAIVRFQKVIDKWCHSSSVTSARDNLLTIFLARSDQASAYATTKRFAERGCGDVH